MNIRINGKETFFEKRVLLAEALKKAGFSVPLYCSGRGVCGRCAVCASGALSEKTESETALPEGVRLSCKTYAEGDCEISVTEQRALPVLCFEKLPSHEAEEGYFVAVDVGTSTIAAVLLCGKEVLEFSRDVNPHISLGADVLTRADASGEDLRRAVSELTKDFFERYPVKRLCITANTAMLCLLTDKDTSFLRSAPFELTEHFGFDVDVGLPIPAYIPNAVSAFIGADVLCGILLCELYTSGDYLLCDIGTNCETAYKSGDRIICASAAAGSSFGELGVPSELIKALYHLKCAGAIDENGALCEENDLVYDKKAEYNERGDTLSGADIFKLLTDKAALKTAQDIVCAENYPDKIFVSGAACGSDVEEAMRGIGIISRNARPEVLQNSALAGAALIASHPKYEALSRELYEKCTALSLVDDKDFERRLAENMKI